MKTNNNKVINRDIANKVQELKAQQGYIQETTS